MSIQVKQYFTFWRNVEYFGIMLLIVLTARVRTKPNECDSQWNINIIIVVKHEKFIGI